MTSPPKLVPVILAGGAGTRLWPMSRTDRPKQFLPLVGEHSLFQETLMRVRDPHRFAPPVIVTNAEYRFLVAEQAREIDIDPAAIVLEPMARNTAPAIAAALLVAKGADEDCIGYVLASDHRIVEDAAYEAALETAIGAAGHGRLVTFGIAPREAATGFGYIEAGAPLEGGGHGVARFVEKPDRAEAEKMIAAGNHYWNSGMFVFSAETFFAECRAHAPDVLEPVQAAVSGARADLDFLRLEESAFARAPNISVDYAIFEKTGRAAVVPARIEWSDLGSWDAVWKAGEKDSSGTVARGPVTLCDVSNALVYSQKHHVVVDGLDDVAVLASEDAIYVGRLSDAQGVRAVVQTLRASPDTLALTETHQTSYRPWGGYTSILSGERFQVKRLFVKPGKTLSLQKHHHRAEHWVVVKGTAQVRIDDTERTLGENQSVYIPQGAVHRLANPGKIELEVIEVQTGAYLAEDDIVRIADAFGRA